MFTIEVEKKRKEEMVTFRYLKMFHQECMGGEIAVNESKTTFLSEREVNGYKLPQTNFFYLTCQRCEGGIGIEKQSGGSTEIIKTSIDGQQRNIKGFTMEYIEKKEGFKRDDEDITVVQKN